MATSAPTPLTKPVPPKPAPLRLNARKADIARIEVHLSDVLATKNATLVVNSGANDVVKVDHVGWNDTGLSASFNQHVYSFWENGKAYLLVDQQARVQAVLWRSGPR